MIVKYAIANVDARELAQLAQDNGLDGSIYSGYGFGAWGVEPTVFLEIATNLPALADSFVQSVLVKYHENCALRIVDGHSAGLLYQTSYVAFE